MEEYHKPVLLREVLKFLDLDCDDERWYLDATLGDGGFALEILKAGCKVLGIDADPKALERTRLRFDRIGFEEGYNYKLIQGNFRDLTNLILKVELEDQKFKCVIFDLGVSSLQLDEAGKGFSFKKQGSLDMRMDPNLAIKAEDLIKGLNKGELNELFSKLGEEKFSRAISDTLVSAREVGSIRTTLELAKLVEGVYRKHGIRSSKIHPATRVFQALRIAVNDELNALREALPQALDILDEGGKVIVISFHSLEDRIVKQNFKEWKGKGFGEVLTKKPIIPDEQEVKDNPRSRSAKMRVFYDNNT